MRYSHIDRNTGGQLHMLENEAFSSQRNCRKKLRFTLLYNSGPDQKVFIDDVAYNFPHQTLLPLFSDQSFSFEDSRSITAWLYNRDFYCIADHDSEVSCAGFIFFGSSGPLFLRLDGRDHEKIDTLRQEFLEEFVTYDNKDEMLKVLLKRLIIIATRLAKAQDVPKPPFSDDQAEATRKNDYSLGSVLRMIVWITLSRS